ncbi:MAG: hypothetical protein HOU81_04690 [Hamadaea sp.]|uniref:hypothetical protein n=1 Tax=Hamadaea sp. TaxID=2024425 RepID=UPI0017981AC4|nr:hypothetical protein [Hamadaea sp.]NUR70095.1 hypothetical protein [Hamadaea sp.]NUT23413.1 hypothetical protein [Hamadaea sp.]
MATFPIVASYAPSGPHSWPVTPAYTVGGHVTGTGLSDLAYSQIPDDEFRTTLDGAFPGFSFFYLGGLLGHYRFRVRSHSVDADGRADLYVVLDADLVGGVGGGRVSDVVGGRVGGREALDPATLRWVQICDGVVDNAGRPHPFYATGGLAPDGSVSFYATWSGVRTAKAYLAHDTGHRDRIGRDIVTVLGGFAYGSTGAETRAASSATIGASSA